jgi:alpha-glucosidase
VFLKAGAIVPMQDALENTKAKSDTIYIHVYKGTEETRFDLYTDDGETYQFQQGEFALRAIQYQPGNNKIILESNNGIYQPVTKRVKLILHGFKIESIQIAGKEYSLKRETLQFFLPLEKFDPLYDPDTMGEEEVLTFELPYTTDEVIFTLQN